MAGKRWTNKEEKFVLDNYANMKINDIAKILNRTEYAVRSKAHSLHVEDKNLQYRWKESDLKFIKDHCNEMTDKEIAKILNRTEEAVKLRRIKMGDASKKRIYKEEAIDLEGEVWKLIPKANKYAISNMGRVKNVKENYLKKPFVNGKNSMSITVRSDEGKTISFSVGKLVADNFLPITYESGKRCKYIQYKNGDFRDTRASNIVLSLHK